ncbi:MAG: cytochrome c oxidase subunit 3 family protein [Candidatus Tectomicrobia bacterium]|uniref:Cytochrome c oxidase subunit 3 family protein n=1 Tax=Tectimicrobiota bacterium TaxID=2528274 RepID=A0A932FW76_UNCTE|nr:cytochrome c oxidase subunit 3 family protein [Candidatus Tectomicrobia bacterium]
MTRSNATARPAKLAHHFEDLTQQHEAANLGMWVFLAQEVLFFGAIFLGYATYRYLYPEVFVAASHHLDVTLGSINTGVLLTSSLTMALSVHAAQIGHRRALVGFLLVTMLLGTVFLGIKGLEYSHKFEEHLVPGSDFRFTGAPLGQARLFFFLYFVMTAIHGLHVLIGIAVIGVIALLAWRGGFSPDYYAPVEGTGLYWHFVDIVWVFLFPLLYLIR